MFIPCQVAVAGRHAMFRRILRPRRSSQKDVSSNPIRRGPFSPKTRNSQAKCTREGLNRLTSRWNLNGVPSLGIRRLGEVRGETQRFVAMSIDMR